jgi:hypothetical protein
VCAEQVDFSCGFCGSDADFGKPSVAGYNFGYSWYAKLLTYG